MTSIDLSLQIDLSIVNATRALRDAGCTQPIYITISSYNWSGDDVQVKHSIDIGSGSNGTKFEGSNLQELVDKHLEIIAAQQQLSAPRIYGLALPAPEASELNDKAEAFDYESSIPSFEDAIVRDEHGDDIPF